jgi:hypothetical protein
MNRRMVMKTLEQLYGRTAACLDGRDMNRLSEFIPEADFPKFGLELKPEFVGKHVHTDFTRENVLKQLAKDVEFGFEKALDKRGISSGLMAEVVQMWNNILEEGMQDSEFDYDRNYAQYGLPIFKATALKYGLPNPIGGDAGDEYRYSTEAD